MSGKLTTHILDISQGCPASGIRLALYRLEFNTRSHLKSIVCNEDGRTDEPLLSHDAFHPGCYEIVFEVGEYFKLQHIKSPFLDQVPIQFHITNSSIHHHVPLLVSPWSYSTYHGS